MAVSAWATSRSAWSARAFGLPLGRPRCGLHLQQRHHRRDGRARARSEPELMKPAVAGAVLSSVATVVQLAILIAATSLETLRAFWLPLVAVGRGGDALWRRLHAVGAAASSRGPRGARQRLQPAYRAAPSPRSSPSSCSPPRRRRTGSGEAGVLIAAAAAGFADTHSAAISVGLAGAATSGSAAPLAVVPDPGGAHDQHRRPR